MKFLFNRKAHNVFKAISDVREALGAQQYIATDEIATVMFLAERLGKPVLTEGPAGSARPSWPRPGPPPAAASSSACNATKD